jgi:2,6-dihydroxypseudooxynicotine hydrolase
VQRLEALYDAGGFDVPGNLRVTDRADESPLVLLLPGLESSKEELTTYEPYLLERGLSTLAIDGAGQGETWYHQPMTTAYPDLVAAVIDHVRDVDPQGVDTGTIGVLGQSLGGFYAPFTAAAESRIQACASISGPFTVGPVSSWSSRLSKEHFLHACQSDSLVEVDDLTERLTLRDRIEDLEAPLLAITGGDDATVAPEQTQRIGEKAPDGEFVCYEGANHICNDVPYRCNTYVADWLRAELT